VTALRSQENKTMLLPAQLDYRALTVSPVDAQIIDMTKLNRSMIAGIFNVPAHMINDLEKATFSNITQQAIQFVRYTMMHWVANWEQELNRRLFTRKERADGYFGSFTQSQLDAVARLRGATDAAGGTTEDSTDVDKGLISGITTPDGRVYALFD
ncbi:phage portal protein, partial [Escherichia coli]|nr:phage portal protein [Escherichia coli]